MTNKGKLAQAIKIEVAAIENEKDIKAILSLVNLIIVDAVKLSDIIVEEEKKVA